MGMSETSYSIPIVYRLHKDLWEKNRQSLEYQMYEAKLKLLESEAEAVPDQEIELVVGLLVNSTGNE